MSSRSVSVSYLKNDPSYEFIGEVILKINIVLCKSGQIFIRFTNID